jgi:hypothetical protein
MLGFTIKLTINGASSIQVGSSITIELAIRLTDRLAPATSSFGGSSLAIKLAISFTDKLAIKLTDKLTSGGSSGPAGR